MKKQLMTNYHNGQSEEPKHCFTDRLTSVRILVSHIEGVFYSVKRHIIAGNFTNRFNAKRNVVMYKLKRTGKATNCLAFVQLVVISEKFICNSGISIKNNILKI